MGYILVFVGTYKTVHNMLNVGYVKYSSHLAFSSLYFVQSKPTYNADNIDKFLQPDIRFCYEKRDLVCCP